MKKFRFRLERVLQYRITVTAEKLRDLMQRNAELRELELRVEALQEAQLRNSLGDGQTMTVDQVYLAGLFTQRIKQEMEEAYQAMEEVKDRVAEALQAYQEAAKEEKALTTLKEKKQREYQEYVQREETRFIDEIATIKGNTFNK